MPESPHLDTSRWRDAAWWPEFRKGLADGAPVFFAFLPLGLSFGMYGVALGLEWWWVTLTGLIIFAGSMEFLAVGMLVAGAPIASAATTALFVNSRHVFYGLSVPLERIRNPIARAYAIHALTDEAYAVLGSKPRDELTGPRMLAVGASTHFYWTASTTVGALAASLIPYDLSFMGFAMTALFVVLTLEALKQNREIGLFGAAVLIGLLGNLLAGELMLLLSLVVYFFVALIVVSRRRGRVA
ncbi:AzlC family ABC transporter permease [Gulosibacter macacae]|nr:AzlC family ABC transporter permease [Gulosibacter macacae]